MDLDLAVLVPGMDEKAVLEILLEKRTHSLAIKPINFQIVVHPGHDSGCYKDAEKFLAPFLSRARHSLVVFDREGCGQESQSVTKLQAEVSGRLSASGWGERASVIVVDPEFDIWLWSDSPHVDGAFGWHGKDPSLRRWLHSQGWLVDGGSKPVRPKEAIEAALRAAKIPRSSSVYGLVAEKISLARCVEPSFLRFRAVMRDWFGTPERT